jgi:hypothetical protein
MRSLPDVPSDLRWQRVEWRVQRVGWVCLALLVLAAAAGMLGPGPLGRARAGGPGDLTVEYHRVEHREAPTAFHVHLPADAVRDGMVRLRLGRANPKVLEIERVTPEPARVEAAPDGLVYVIHVADGGPAEVRFSVRFERSGLFATRLGLPDDGRAVDFRQLVLP